jgi:hypothetical protein
MLFFAVVQYDVDLRIFMTEVRGESLGKIDGTMLAAGTAK